MNGKFPSKYSDDPEERSLHIFVNTMKMAKKGKRHDSTLTQEHINILESIPGWTWDKDTKALQRIDNLREFITTNNRWPSASSESPYEKSLAYFVRTVAYTKTGKGKYKLTQESIDALESIPGWRWGKDPHKTLKRVDHLKDFLRTNNRWPSQLSKDPLEKSLYVFITEVRESKRGKGKSKLTKEHIESLESVPGWKWDKDPDKTLKHVVSLKEFVEANNRWPNTRSENLAERSLSRLMESMRAAKKGTGNYKITPTHIEVLESIKGWKWGQDPINTLKRVDDLKEFMVVNDRLPRYNSKDPIEKSLYNFTLSMKTARNGTGDNKITPEHIEALEKIPGWKW